MRQRLGLSETETVVPCSPSLWSAPLPGVDLCLDLLKEEGLTLRNWPNDNLLVDSGSVSEFYSALLPASDPVRSDKPNELGAPMSCEGDPHRHVGV